LKFRKLSREFLALAVPAAAVVAAVFVIAIQYVEPAPPGRAVMTAGGAQGAYFANAQRYKAKLAKSGIELEVKTSAGTLENLARLSDPKSGVQIAFVQGGLADATTHPDLASLGRMFLEPLWVFHRTDVKIERLADFKGLRLAPGPEGSGTRPFVLKLLQSSGVTAENSVMIGTASGQSVSLLTEGQLDVVFLSMAAEGALVQKLLREPDIKLMNFANAEAYVRLFPYLTKIVLPVGVVDLAGNIPAQDVQLLATPATLVVRRDLHPAIVGLLVEAAKELHGSAALFAKMGEYPLPQDSELPLDVDAVRYYKNGPPFLERYLPFWLATFLERTAVLIIPMATVLVPIVKFGPMAYTWRNRRRLLHWYGQLKKLERGLKVDRSMEALVSHSAEMHRIEDAVANIKMPLMFSDQLYNLRAAVELVRQRIQGLMQVATHAASRGAEAEAAVLWNDQV
jgi:TRAP transporter TAXI family solute receptor